jgi:hypothetical protein
VHQQAQLDVSAALSVRQGFGTVLYIEDWPGSSNLDHNYLFLSDITSDKMLGCDQDNRVGEFGSQASKNGRFSNVGEGGSIRDTTILCEARGYSFSRIRYERTTA